MTKDLVRKCSHCGHNGHNCRTCNGKNCIKLFGKNIDVLPLPIDQYDPITRTRSLDRLSSYFGEGESSAMPPASVGYLSDSPDKKKGKPWTEDEHRSFLIGLENVGRGDWRGISKKYVKTRTSTQVASHAQKHFLRMAMLEKNKKRSSVFDIVIPDLPKKDEDMVITQSKAEAHLPISNEPILNDSSHQSDLTLPLFHQGSKTREANMTLMKCGETSTPIVPSSEKPPLSPSMRYINNGFSKHYYRMQPVMVGPSTARVGPSLAFVSRMSHPPQPQLVYYPSPVPVQHLIMYPCTRQLMHVPPRQHEVALPPPPATMTPISKKDGLDLSLRALTL